MQWDNTPNAGFCPPTVKPWLPIAADYTQTNVAIEREDRHSTLALTRALLQLRRTTPALSVGSYTPIEGVPDDCFVYMRQFGKQRHIIALNFSGNEQQVHLPKIGSARILLSTHLDREESLDLASLRLRGDEGYLIEVGDTM
jgi:alpha-glucosidase